MRKVYKNTPDRFFNGWTFPILCVLDADDSYQLM
jgi:hypothetical protein